MKVSFDSPFIDEISKYPVRFAAPVFFGESPHRSLAASLQNGTATLLKLEGRFLAITCQHVVEGFRRRASAGETFFQVAHARLNPEEHLIDENVALDLAVLDITPFVDRAPHLTEANFASAPTWPPRQVSAEDVICMAGFPGVWREQIDEGYLRFYSFSSGAAEVVSVRDSQLATTVQIEQCINQLNHGLVLGSLGGLSGGPVFAWRKTPVLHAELIGFIYEYQETFDLMLVRLALLCHLRSGALRRKLSSMPSSRRLWMM
jgi:hypothetical protein